MSDFTMQSKDFDKALNQEMLIGSHCLNCGENAVPQRQICPQCRSEKTEIISFSGRGKLVAFTVISVPPVKMAQAGYSAKNPYCSGIVELVEGPRISAQIHDVDMQNPENIKIGTPLTMTILKRNELDSQSSYLAFKPA